MATNIQIFTAPAAARIVGISYSRLDSWDRRGNFFKPSIAEADGRGSQRVYSFEDLVQLGAIKTLRNQGASLQSLRKAQRTMRRLDLEKPWQYVIVVGKDLHVEVGEETMMSLKSQPGQTAFQIVCLLEVAEEVRLAIELERIERGFERQRAREAASA